MSWVESKSFWDWVESTKKESSPCLVLTTWKVTFIHLKLKVSHKLNKSEIFAFFCTTSLNIASFTKFVTAWLNQTKSREQPRRQMIFKNCCKPKFSSQSTVFQDPPTITTHFSAPRRHSRMFYGSRPYGVPCLSRGPPTATPCGLSSARSAHGLLGRRKRKWNYKTTAGGWTVARGRHFHRVFSAASRPRAQTPTPSAVCQGRAARRRVSGSHAARRVTSLRPGSCGGDWIPGGPLRRSWLTAGGEWWPWASIGRSGGMFSDQWTIGFGKLSPCWVF